MFPSEVLCVSSGHEISKFADKSIATLHVDIKWFSKQLFAMDRLNLTYLSVWIPIVALVTSQSCIVASAVKLTKLIFLNIQKPIRVILLLRILQCQSLLYSQLCFWHTFKVHKPNNSNLNDKSQMLGDIKKDCQLSKLFSSAKSRSLIKSTLVYFQ